MSGAVFLCLALLFQEEGMAVHVRMGENLVTYAFLFQQFVNTDDRGLPMVKVRFAKVQIKDGKFDRELRMEPADRYQMRTFTREQFRFLRPDGKMGIFKYQLVSKEKKPSKRGFFLEAIPLSMDGTVASLTKEARENADLMSLLDMDMDSILAATENESQMETAIEKAKVVEIEQLRDNLSDSLILFLPTRSK